jgi:hypothetical protein
MEGAKIQWEAKEPEPHIAFMMQKDRKKINMREYDSIV